MNLWRRIKRRRTVTGTKRRSDLIRMQRVVFLCEQDGLPERELKIRLTQFFERAFVRRAHLARVAYEQGGATHVALCVRGQPGQDRIFGERVGEIFASIFGSHEHIDVIWLAEE
jgi:hypothetical protein